MNKYESHKVVDADKIISFKPMPDEFIVTLYGEVDALSLTIKVGFRIAEMMANKPDDLGYLVIYDGGTPDEYTSWSPSPQFEAGYDLVQPSSGKSKIKGYRELNEREIELINEIKKHGILLGQLVDGMRTAEGWKGPDQRWVSIGATDLQTGLMALTRSIAKPEFF